MAADSRTPPAPGARAPLGHRLADLRQLNLDAVLSALRERGPRTLNQLTTATHLSRPTISTIIDELIRRGWVAPADDLPGGGRGRPARAFRFRAEAAYVAGADIGPHSTAVAVADLGGTVLAEVRIAEDPATEAAPRLRSLVGALNDASVAAGIRDQGVFSMAVGVPGIVGPTGRIKKSLIIPEWTGVDLAARLTETTGVNTVVENDANLGAIGERWVGAAQLAEDVVYLHAGHRVSAGLLLGGRLHRGRTGAAGEIGSLERLGWGDLDGEVIAAAVAGRPDPVAVDHFIGRLAEGLGLLTHTVDPEVIVIGGGLAGAGEILLEPLREALDRLVWDAPEIRLSRLAARSAQTGAIRLALDRLSSLIG